MTGLVNVVDSLVGTLGSLGTVTLGANIGNFIKNFGEYKNTGAIMNAVSSFGEGSSDFKAIIEATKTLSAENAAAALSYTNLSAKQQVNVLRGRGVEKTIAQQMVAQNSLSAVNRVAANTQGLLGRATDSLKNSFKGLGAAIKANPIGFAISGTMLAISVISSLVDKHNQKIEEVNQKTIETGNTAKEEALNIIDSYNSFSQANFAYKNNAGSKKELQTATESLLETLGYEKSAVGELTQEYTNLDNAINNITIDTLDDKIKEMVSGYGVSSDKLLDLATEMGSENLVFRAYGSSTEQGKTQTNALLKLKNAGYGSFSPDDTGHYHFRLMNDISNIEDAQDLYERLVEIKDVIYSGTNEGLYSTEELLNTDLFKELDYRIGYYEETYNKVKSDIEDINKTVAHKGYLQYTLTNGIPQTLDEFKAMQEKLMQDAKENDIFKSQFVGSEEDVQTAIRSTLSSFPELSTFVGAYNEELRNLEKTEAKRIPILEKVAKLQTNGVSDFKVNSPHDAKKVQEINGWIDTLNNKQKEIVYDISVDSDDSQFWSLDRWQQELTDIESGAKATNASMQQFYDIIKNADEGSLSEGLKSHVEQISTLQDYYSKISTTGLTDNEKIDLIMAFPELEPYINDTDGLKDSISELVQTTNQNIDTAIEDTIKNMNLEGTAAATALRNLKDEMFGLSDFAGFEFNLDSETEKFSNLYSALSESVSATGMTSESIKKVNAMFSELEGYDPSQLFERTESGIHMNVDALRNLQKQYDIQKKQDIDSHLKNLQNQYKGLTDQINKATSSSERAKLISQRDNLADDITAVADLATQYDGLTSAYNRWIQAQSDDNERSMYEGIIGGKETIEDLITRGWAGSDEVRSYIDLISAEDLSNATVEEVMKAYEKIGQEIGKSGYSLWDFLTVDEDGNSTSEGGYRFFDTVKDVLGETYAWIDENGFYNFDFGQGKDEEVAKALGMDVEYLQSILRAMSDAGFKINLDAEYSDIENFIADAETARDAWKSLIELSEEGKIDFDVSSIDLNATDIDSITSQIENVQGLLSDFRNTDGTINTNLEGAEELRTILIDLITKKQEINSPVFIGVDTSQVDSEAGEAIEILQNIWDNYNDIEINTALGVDTSNAQGNIRELVLQLSNLSPEIKTKLNLDNADFNAAVGRLQASVRAGVDINPEDLKIVETTLSGITSNMMVEAGIDDSAIQGYNPDNKTSSVQYTVNQAAIDRWTPPTKTGIARYTPTLNSYTVPTLYGNLVLKTSGNAKHEGTAFSQGNWGIKGSGVALGGELGMEILVRDGEYYTIGENSAEFFKYQPNDIIFNAEQSRELLEKGKITRSKRRGKAFADGTISSSGKAFSRGGGGMSRPSFNTTTSSTDSSSNSSNSSNSSSATNEAEEFLETIDWIEVAIDRIERAIDTLDLKASSTYRDWSVRNKALTDEIGMISDEIDLQQKAYTRYMQEANSVGLSADYVAKVQNGIIDIEKITDESLKERIDDYEQWYNKAIDCRDAVDDLTESLSECYKVAFDNIITQYEGIFSRIELEKNLLEEYIGQAETKGYIVSVKYYQMLMERERDNIGQLQQQKAELEMSMENALKSGAIKKGSEEWSNMSEEIRNVTYEIEQGNSALIEYAKNIQDIKWETFDFIQERVANLSTETQFLVELLSNSKLYTDKGQFTSEGKSVAGLHAVDYNTYMSQADDYAKEMQKINSELAKDPANIELEKRRDELLKLQQESIMAAEDEKQAIVDMVKEGIELELSSLQDLIDTHNEALDSAKDLYDYQNKVKEQTSEISSLQKQLQAYSGDTSEETRTTIQKLQVSLADAEQSLEETQYDKYISDSKKMMDELYLDYETTLNKRLDNIDGLISDIITAVNDSQVEIASTLYSAVDKVGYTMSEATTAIWGKAYETTQAENQQRLEQVQSVVNKLEESKTLASTDANSILTAIGNGNVQNVNDTIEIIKSLTANGNITTNMRDELLSSLNVNNPKTALESLGLIGTLEESSKLSREDADVLREAIATGNTANSGHLASITQKLIENGALSISQAAEMISAITGTNETNVSSALKAIDTLVKDNQLSEYETHTLMTSLIDDNAKNLENSANIIGGLIANGKIEAENASDIISAFSGNATANDNISNALRIIDDLSKSKKLTNEEINTLVGGIMGGNTSGLEGIITQLMVNNDISSKDAADIIKAVGNSKTDVSIMQTALKSVDTLLNTGSISIKEAESIVNGILGGGAIGLSGIISQLIANKDISSQDAANIVTAVGNSKIDITTMQGALESVDTLLKNGKISISEAQSIIDGLTGNSTAIGGIAGELVKNLGLTEEVDRITSALGKVNTKTDVGKLESSLGSVSDLLNNGSISLKEAGSIVTSLLGGESDGVNSIIQKLVANGELTSRKASDIKSAIESAKPDMSGLKDIVSTGDKINNSLTTINDSLKGLKSLLGDINGDLVVNARDAAMLDNALATGKTDTLSSNADFNQDGKIDARDSAAIARYLATLAPKSYATGVKNLNKDQLAWTQENGGLEYIIRPSDGAILTPLAKNDSVLNASASSNLWSVANNPEQFIRDNLGLSAISAPTIQKSAENTYNGDMNFSVTLPNVQNYEQFKYAMQRDKSFERFIRSVSVDRLFGKSSISKYKT